MRKKDRRIPEDWELPRGCRRFLQLFSPDFLHDFLVMGMFLILGTLLAFFLNHMSRSIIDVSFIYIMAVVLIARLTSRYLYGFIASVISIMCINFFFTYPYMHINFLMTGYPIAFFGMLLVSFFMSAATTSLKKQARIIEEREEQLVAAEKEKMRANLLRAISHDLRTPLTSIIGNSTTYIDHASSLSDREKLSLVKNIREDADWLLNMVENILTVTRIHTSGAKVTKSMEPIEEVVSEAVQRLKKRIPDARINVRVPDDFLMIPMDAILIEQVIINLTENAFVHSQSSQPIDLYVTCEENSVSFHVRDYGVGIPNYKLPDIFDGTGSAANTAPDGKKGMGIGLSICKTIIDAHDGILTAYNMDIGAEFCFTLPKGAPDPEEQSSDAPPA